MNEGELDMVETRSGDYYMGLADKLERDRDLTDEEFVSVLLVDDPQFSEYPTVRTTAIIAVSDAGIKTRRDTA